MSKKCLRCGNDFENSIPPITNPEGIRDIGSSEWCADCNALAMTVIYRHGSAYSLIGKIKDTARRVRNANP